MSNLQKPKTKIIVRIRNPKEKDAIKGKKTTTKPPVEEKKLSQTLNKSSSAKSKTGSKSSTASIEGKNKLTTDANYTIFTSMERSNICVVTNNPISGKLVQETFQTSNEIYDYSVNLMNESSILEFDSVYSEQHK
jgi:hypothetical protein